MIASLTIQLARTEGALVRLLGLVERRGFVPVRLTAEPLDAQVQTVHIGVVCERPLERLIHQLNKLYDVLHVERTT